MAYRMYLDDIRNPKNEGLFIVVRSFAEAFSYIQDHGYPIHISFDHDLGDNTLSGFDFAKWLVDSDMDCGWMTRDFTYNIHSANPVGRDNIDGLLKNYLAHKGFL